MRHFYQVDANGTLLGAAASGGGGFSEDVDLTDPGCMHPLAIDLQRVAAGVPGFDRYVEYLCPCPGTVGHCQCAYLNLPNYYAEGSSLLEKPLLTVLVDDTPIGDLMNSAPVERVPGTSSTLKLQGDIPDGHQVDVHNAGSILIIPETTTLTFTGGETNVVQLVAPTHAAVGRVVGLSKLVRQFRVQLKGWSA